MDSVSRVLWTFVFFVVLGLSIVIARKIHRHCMATTTDLHDPLLPADAEEGFHPCTVCGFENFRRCLFCSICGSQLPRPISPKTKLLEPHVESLEARDNFTARQRRARQRKEWTRKLGVEGKSFWYRDEACQTDGKARFDAQVVQFALVQPEGWSKPSASSDSVQTLAEEARLVALQLVSLSHANPILSPLCTTVATDVHRTFSDHGDLVEWSAKDFPTKYAKFVAHTWARLSASTETVIRHYLSRDRLLRQSMENLNNTPAEFMGSLLQIIFVGETGIDAGGLRREWFALLDEAICQKSSGIFKCVNEADQTLYLNDNSEHDIGEDHLMYFHSVGRFIGRALLEGATIGFHLAPPLLKIILGLPLSFTDLEYFDPQAYTSMVWLADNDGVEALGLDFSVTVKRGDTMAVVDLIPNGSNVSVTDANKVHYLERKFQYLLLESVSAQLYVFLKGLYEVVPHELLMMFDPEELDYVLCGSDEIDVGDWERSAKHSDSLTGRPVKSWFWELVREMPNEYRRRLLQFATGSDRVPLSGFNSLTSSDDRICPFTLNGVPLENGGNIWSHSCFNRLDLPLYQSRETLGTALFGVLEADSQGFTTA